MKINTMLTVRNGVFFTLFFLVLRTTAGWASPPVPISATDRVRVTIKFLRINDGGDRIPIDLVQSSCPPCVQRSDPDFARENRRETIVALDVPAERSLELTFRAPPDRFDRALIQTQDLKLIRKNAGEISVGLPPLSEDTIEASEFVTNIVGQGYVLRFEHADPERRFGAYAKGIPVPQRQAANNLEFAFREAVIELGLGRKALQEHAGIIEIMGFDTNEPHGHRDAPPHVHMHLRWPYNTGTQIGHFYLASNGRLERIVAGISGLSDTPHKFGEGQTFTTIAPQGHAFYAMTLTHDGALTLSLPDGRTCQIGASGDNFSEGIQIACSNHDPVLIHVVDDQKEGIITAFTGALVETFRYDQRTGILSSADHTPLHEASAVVPTYESVLRGTSPAP